MADEEQDQTNPEQPESTDEQNAAEDAAPTPEGNAEEALDAASAAVDDLTAEAADAENSEQANDILKAAMEAVSHANSDDTATDSADGGDTSAFDLPNLDPAAAATADESLDLLSDVNLNVKVELGRTRMLVEDVLRLADGAVVELDKLAGDPVDIYVNDRPIARGEVLVLNDSFCIRVNEIVSTEVIKRERAS